MFYTTLSSIEQLHVADVGMIFTYELKEKTYIGCMYVCCVAQAALVLLRPPITLVYYCKTTVFLFHHTFIFRIFSISKASNSIKGIIHSSLNYGYFIVAKIYIACETVVTASLNLIRLLVLSLRVADSVWFYVYASA